MPFKIFFGYNVEAAVIEYLRPDADDVDGGWTNELDGTTLFSSIDEVTEDDSDFIKSSLTPSADMARIRISDPSTALAEPFHVEYRYKKLGVPTVDLVVRLKQGTTQIAAWTHSNIADSFVTTTQTLSSGEFSSITDFTNLFIELEANTP
jgi:hypothetical protein